jgi:hypothetical protein
VREEVALKGTDKIFYVEQGKGVVEKPSVVRKKQAGKGKAARKKRR